MLSHSCAFTGGGAVALRTLSLMGGRTELLYDGTSVSAGRFVCRPGDALWRAENTIGDRHHIVFARRPVRISQRGHAPVCADRSRAMVYDADQTYSRELLHPDGDVADFVAVAPTVLAEAFEAHGLGDEGSFGTAAVPLPDAVFLSQRLLFRDLGTRGQAPGFELEEGLLRLVDSVVAACGRPAAPTRAVHRELAEAATALLSTDLGRPLRLADLGRELHVSPYHLARVFRAQTGSSLHAYRESERLRAVVDHGLARPRTLSGIAADLGFSSHSHLTSRFRRRFGTTPSLLGAG